MVGQSSHLKIHNLPGIVATQFIVVVGKKVEGKPKTYYGMAAKLKKLAAGELSHTVFMMK